MERLTEKTIGCFEYSLKDHKPVPGEFGTYEAFFDYSMAVKKLGEYEDAEEAKAKQSMTNGDRIRAMTDEELADYLAELGSEANNGVIYSDRPEEWLEYLKQPAKEETWEKMADTIFKSIYPLTIVSDRYSGTYSHGAFTAWNLETNEVPTEIASDDVTCCNFWGKNLMPCGKGATVEEAVANLYIVLHQSEPPRGDNHENNL